MVVVVLLLPTIRPYVLPPAAGGLYFIIQTVVAIVDCTFTRCSALGLSPNTTGYGGAVCVDNTVCDLSHTSITNCSADYGGALAALSGVSTMSNGSFFSGHATYSGNSVLVYGGVATYELPTPLGYWVRAPAPRPSVRLWAGLLACPSARLSVPSLLHATPTVTFLLVSAGRRTGMHRVSRGVRHRCLRLPRHRPRLRARHE